VQDAPLGVTTVAPSSVDIALPVGAVLLLYTDGLVERRGESLDLGLQRLASALVADEPETVCQKVMAALVGGETPGDDIALLAMRRVAAS
jgi:serine phosphatase RsbU (regulator of sigma subunit)